MVVKWSSLYSQGVGLARSELSAQTGSTLLRSNAKVFHIIFYLSFLNLGLMSESRMLGGTTYVLDH